MTMNLKWSPSKKDRLESLTLAHKARSYNLSLEEKRIQTMTHIHSSKYLNKLIHRFHL